ncbi:MAG: cysteine hydrolase family protein [Bulleidia sp.]
MTRVLVVVDMQNDFISGSLGSDEAKAIVPAVIREISDLSYDQIIATMDTHPASYLHTHEGKYLPVEHCIRGSAGWMIADEVQSALDQREKIVKVFEKPTFGSETLAEEMKKINPDEIVLIGLCTDICVISNALLLRAALPETEISVKEDACAGVTKEKHACALEVMRSCQINVR